MSMTLREILIWPDPELSTVAQKVSGVDDGVRLLIRDLFDTMYDSKGIGLAATQVGVHRRVLVLDLDPYGEAVDDPEVRAELDEWGFEGPLALVNPEIVYSEGDIVWDEGCLSVPGYTDKVKRKERIRVEAFDKDGQDITIEASGLFSVAIQHEMDHLVGRVFVEYLSRLKRDSVKRKMHRLKQKEHDDETGQALG
jgi:peptide deformylase